MFSGPHRKLPWQSQQAWRECSDGKLLHRLEAYKKLLAIPEINYVILATPPHFRPAHLKGCNRSGQECIHRKPCAVDAPACAPSWKLANSRRKRIWIVSGTQRRHLKSYNETIKRIQDGALGELVYGSCYWNGGVIWTIDRKPRCPTWKWQLRDWGYFTGSAVITLSSNTCIISTSCAGSSARRRKSHGVGGRQARPNHPNFGHIYDHFAVELNTPTG